MEASWHLLRYKEGENVELYEMAWIDASVCKPKEDIEVIVLLETPAEGYYKIAFGHIVDKNKCVDYNGWNIEGVRYWLPCPEMPK